MQKHPTLFLTHRALVHQKTALEAAPAELDVTIKRSPTKEEVIELLPEVEFLITERTGVIDADMMAAGKRLRLVQRLGSQVHDIDLEAARLAGIPVCFRPVYTAVTVAEHMLMQMLSLAKRAREMMHISAEAKNWGVPSVKCDEDHFVINWSRREGIWNIYRRTVGIVGFGEIGTELSRRLQNFDCTVLYYKRSQLPPKAESQLKIRYTPLDELLSLSDYVCSLLPFSADTEKSINGDFVARMKPGACLVHCGASGILDEEAVAKALETGKLYGLATDAYAWEPIRPDNPLLPLAHQPDANILLTPHTAVGDINPRVNWRQEEYENLLNLLYNRPLLYRLV
ncbi:MAG: hypothetical protein IT308_08965 [Anaerolineaceae bacterium]|nr:hypothetical protein [Anaerolineaceae bacterium]